jgi:uncharacterized protein YgiM (DUF1202 family)
MKMSNLRSFYVLANVASLLSILALIGGWFAAVTLAISFVAIPTTQVFAEEVPVAGEVDVNSTLNFRSSPNGKIMSSLGPGTKVEILSDSGTWWKVKVGGKTGYVFKQYINVTKTENKADTKANAKQTKKKTKKPGKSTVSEHDPIESLKLDQEFPVKATKKEQP